MEVSERAVIGNSEELNNGFYGLLRARARNARFVC